MNKVCFRCKEIKPLAMFCKNKRKRDGIDSYCRPCKTSIHVERKSANPDRVLELAAARMRSWRKRNPIKDREAQERNNVVRRALYKPHPQPRVDPAISKAMRKEAARKRYLVGRARILANNRSWVKANKERHRSLCNLWRENNAQRFKELSAKSAERWLASKRQATPKWSNIFVIQEIYHLAQLRTKHLGCLHHVDHIVPLQSDLVCGLHVEHNLQIVPASFNCSKGNRVWPDMPGEK